MTIQRWLVRFGWAVVLVVSFGTFSARASFHLWEVVEAFSSADGSIQFIELQNPDLNSQHQAHPSRGFTTNANSFDYPEDLSSSLTANKKFLMGTASYDALAQVDVNVPVPDYIVIDNFFSTTGDTLSLTQNTSTILDTITFTAGELPTDGTNSLNHAFLDSSNTFFSAINSPTNFAGETGTVTIVTPSADFDNDGDVDGEDFLKWQRGESPNALSAEDLALWEGNYGTTVPLSAILTAIPEPASAMLLIVPAGVGILPRRSRSLRTTPMKF